MAAAEEAMVVEATAAVVEDQEATATVAPTGMLCSANSQRPANDIADTATADLMDTVAATHTATAHMVEAATA